MAEGWKLTLNVHKVIKPPAQTWPHGPDCIRFEAKATRVVESPPWVWAHLRWTEKDNKNMYCSQRTPCSSIFCGDGAGGWNRCCILWAKDELQLREGFLAKGVKSQHLWCMGVHRQSLHRDWSLCTWRCNWCRSWFGIWNEIVQRHMLLSRQSLILGTSSKFSEAHARPHSGQITGGI